MFVDLAERADAEQLENAAVGTGLVAVLVEVEAPAVLATEPVVGAHHADHPRRLEPVAERGVHHLAGMITDIEADFIHQCDRPNRESPAGHHLVERLDRHALFEHQSGLVEVRHQDPVDPESGRVGHDNHRLPHPATKLHRRHDGTGVGAIRRNDFEQRHLLDG